MKKNTRFLVTAALIAAVYAVLTYVAAALGLAYGEVQFRFSEALCVLAAYTPAAIPGLTVGCLLANLGSTLGPIDWVCGTAATLLASVCTYALRNVRIRNVPWLAPLPSVVFNALIVGAELAWLFADTGAFAAAFAINALWVGIGEAAVCFVLGVPLCMVINRVAPLRHALEA